RLRRVELALGTVEGAASLGLRQPLEVAERLEQRDLEPVVADHRADFGRRAVEGEEVGLENLHAVEAGGGDRRQLLVQVAAQGNCGDRRPHFRPSSTMPISAATASA